jgi:hypothetical protein
MLLLLEEIMIDKDEIIFNLEDNDLDEVVKLKSNNDLLIVKFSYVFDNLENESAKVFADEEFNGDDEEEWNYEYFLPCLSDMAVDNVEEIVEECAEDMNLEYQLVALDLSIEEHEKNVFLAAFYNEGYEVELENYLMEIL